MRSAGKAKNKRGKAAGKKLMRSKSRLQKLKKAKKSSHSTELPMEDGDWEPAVPADDEDGSAKCERKKRKRGSKAKAAEAEDAGSSSAKKGGGRKGTGKGRGKKSNGCKAEASPKAKAKAAGKAKARAKAKAKAMDGDGELGPAPKAKAKAKAKGKAKAKATATKHVGCEQEEWEQLVEWLKPVDFLDGDYKATLKNMLPSFSVPLRLNVYWTKSSCGLSLRYIDENDKQKSRDVGHFYYEKGVLGMSVAIAAAAFMVPQYVSS